MACLNGVTNNLDEYYAEEAVSLFILAEEAVYMRMKIHYVASVSRGLPNHMGCNRLPRRGTIAAF